MSKRTCTKPSLRHPAPKRALREKSKTRSSSRLRGKPVRPSRSRPASRKAAAKRLARHSLSARLHQRFTDFYNQQAARANSIAARHGVSDPESIAQNAFLKTYFAIDARRKSFAGLFHTILQREILNELRRMYRRPQVEPFLENFDVADATESEFMGSHDLLEELEIALRQLTPADRKLMRLIYKEGYRLEEIAQQL